VTQDQKTRLGGLLFIVSGAFLGYLSIWRTYQEAVAGSRTLVLNRSGIALSILFPLMGVILAIGGEPAMVHIKAHTAGRKTKLGWAYVAIIAAIALGVYYVVETKFESMGYTI
jgi:heme/copper-type cytochrome/quinol oxidase subunit 3